MTDTGGSGALEIVGVGPRSERVYRAILRNPGSTPTQLADRIGRPLTDVTDDLRALVQAGLITLAAGAARAAHAEPPQIALGRLLAREERRLVAAGELLAHARVEVAHYEIEHQAGLRPRPAAAGVDLIDSGELAAVTDSLALTTSGEMLFIRPDQWRSPGGRRADDTVIRALEAGRASRVLYPTEVQHEADAMVRRRVDAGERTRLLTRLPCRLAVYGADAALLPPTLTGSTGNALLIRQPGLVAAFREWFEELWRRAVAYPADGDQLADPRAPVLALMARGVKDERIARTLGLSLRTVRRRTAAILEELGVDTRFEAGAEAVRRGWI